MESNKNLASEQGKTPSDTTTGNTTTGSAPQRAREQATETAREVLDQTKQAVTNAYEKTAETLTQTYDQAVTYGKENPGTMTLIAFGAGIGIGLLLASGLGGRSTTRTSRIVDPVVDALAQIAREVFR
jgi:ElaB/YqjD/DUF883 family membrane-anchored ribosome-binding protein